MSINKYCNLYNFLQTLNLAIIALASKIYIIIKLAVKTTCGICKIHTIQNGRRIQTNIYNVETLDGCQPVKTSIFLPPIFKYVIEVFSLA